MVIDETERRFRLTVTLISTKSLGYTLKRCYKRNQILIKQCKCNDIRLISHIVVLHQSVRDQVVMHKSLLGILTMYN